MRVYIAGKITDYPEATQKFAEAEKLMRKKLYEPINPCVLTPIVQFYSYEDTMHVCFALIDICDAVYFLDNWKESKGACMEYGYAIAKGKEILFE